MLYTTAIKILRFFSFVFWFVLVFLSWFFITYKESLYATWLIIYDNFYVYVIASLFLAIPVYLLFGRFTTSGFEKVLIKILESFEDK